MKRLFIFITILGSFPVYGQEKKPAQKISIGFNFSPDYSFRTLKNNEGSSSGDFILKNRNSIELAKFGFTTGLNVCFYFSSLAGLETGIQFTNKGYKTKNQDLIYFPPYPNSPVKAKYIYSYQYIGVPLKVKFTAGKNKLRFLASAGFLTNFLLNVKNTAKYEYSNGKTEETTQSTTKDFKTIDISPMISVGLDYKLNDKINFIAEPVFRYGIIKTMDAPVTENLWNAGLNIGFYYGLR